MEKQKNSYFALSISSVLFLIVWYLVTNSSYNGSVLFGINTNLFLYVGDILLFFIASILFKLISSRTDLKILDNAIVAKWVPICETIIVGYILIWNYLNENNIYPEDSASAYIRHNIFPLLAIVIVGLAVALIENIKIEFKNKFRWLLSIVVASIVALCEYTPNPFNNKSGTLYHIDAYINSIINFVNGEPYSELNKCIYGHYAILYYPIVKLIGGYEGINVAVSLVAFFTIMAFSVAGILCIKNAKVFLLYEMALMFGMTELGCSGVYWQCFPHRCFFPALLICWVAYIVTKEKTKYIYELIGWLICFLSLVWNFETGLVCLISYLVFTLIKKYNVKILSLNLMITISVSFLSYAFVSAINKAIGGCYLSIKEFIYPLLSDNYQVSDLSIGILSGIHISALFTLVLTIALLVAFERLIHGHKDSVNLIIFFVSLIALGVFVYGINRPAYGCVAIALLQFILVISLIVDNISVSDDVSFLNNTNVVVKRLLSVVLTILAVEAVFYSGKALSYKESTSWNTSTYEYITTAKLKNVVPNSTPAFGAAVNILYESVGYKNVYYLTDFPDIDDSTKNYINDEIMKYEYVLLGETCGELSNLSKFEVIDEIDASGYKYYYCKNTTFSSEE